jgi:two-component system cell cycle response regulator
MMDAIARACAADGENLTGEENYRLAQISLDEAAGIADPATQRAVQGWAYVARARGAQRLGRTLEAARDLHEAIATGFRARGADPEGGAWLGRAYHRLAIVYDVIGDPATAVRMLRHALDHYQHAGNDAAMGWVHNSLGIIYSRTGDYPRALERFAAALRHAEQVGDEGRLLIALSNQALTLRLAQRPLESVHALERAMALSAIDEVDDYRFLLLANLGVALAAAGRPDEARVALAQAHERIGSVREPMQRAEYHRARGEFLESVGEIAPAAQAFREALAIADGAQIEALIPSLHEALARTERALGRHGEAEAHARAWRLAQVAQETEQRNEDLEQETLRTELAVLATEHARLAEAMTRLRRAHDELAGTVDELRSAAGRDPLTDLANRRGFEVTLANLARDSGSGALILIDLDTFKSINDEHGHAVGDEVLRAVAALLAREAEGGARLGGDEFALVVAVEAAEANAMATRLRDALRAHFATGLAVTASFGVATLGEVDGDPTRLVLLADERLYRAKRRGRDRVEPAGNV